MYDLTIKRVLSDSTAYTTTLTVIRVVYPTPILLGCGGNTVQDGRVLLFHSIGSQEIY